MMTENTEMDVNPEMDEAFETEETVERDYSGLIVLGSFGLGVAAGKITDRLAPKVKAKAIETKELLKAKFVKKKDDESIEEDAPAEVVEAEIISEPDVNVTVDNIRKSKK